MTATKRETLIETAVRLFCAHGVHAVGIDRVIAEAEVAKATLYKHFPSKDDLVVAALGHLDRVGRGAIEAAARAVSKDPRGRFAGLASAVAEVASNGCMFVLAAQEFPDPAHPVHQAAAEHKQRMRELFSKMAAEAGAGDPGCIGEKAQLVLDGLYSSCAVSTIDGVRATALAGKMLLALLDGE